MDASAGWYAVALGADLDPGTSMGTRLFGQELVVWRDTAGTAHVWEDRCPHRGMRLSFGFVRGDHIACLYHGWQYDAAGQCRYIPAHPGLEVSPMIRTRTYASRERQGFVFVSWAAETADPDSAPDAPTTPVRSLYLDAPASAVLARFEAAPGPDGLVRTQLADLPVIVAVQPLSRTESAAHVVIGGPAEAHGGEDRARVAAVLTGLRRAAESAAAHPRTDARTAP